MSSEQAMRRIDGMQRSLDQMGAQVGALEQRIAELRQDKAGLEGFRGRVSYDQGQFEATLARKRQAAARARQVSNSRIAEGLSAMMSQRLNSSFSGGVAGCFTGVQREVSTAIARIDGEIARLNGQIASTQADMARTRRSIAAAREEYDRERTAEQAQG